MFLQFNNWSALVSNNVICSEFTWVSSDLCWNTHARYGIPAFQCIYIGQHWNYSKEVSPKKIFPGHSYDEARSISNMPTLFERRTKLCQSYFRKMHNADHKLNKLLPNQRYTPYGLRTHKTLPVPLARTDRFRRSLIPLGLANWQHNVL